jgi:L-seryl-tRNA(Ser) seleniumtransferase
MLTSHGVGDAALRRLPAVGTLLAEPEVESLVEKYGKTAVTGAVRRAIATARAQILSGAEATVSAKDVAQAITEDQALSLRGVINATGVLLHTNLGRAPLAKKAQEAIAEVARGYCSVEIEVESGQRGDRHRHVTGLLASLLECGGGLAFNNNAGAVMLMLAALCRGREVIVARGELVEIGGGFRVPDVMRESGATLVEVGTTNKVYERDYRAAITEKTAAILRVHRSNFALVGFTAEPEHAELARLAKERGIYYLVDNGSGLLAGEKELGEAWTHVREEPRPIDALRAGADLIAFSGDKLLGGPQAGILAGNAKVLEIVRKHPLARAMRADKMTLAGLEATLRLYRDGRAAEIPIIRDLSVSLDELDARAQKIAARLATRGMTIEVKAGDSVPGGGSLPLARLPTRLILVGRSGEAARALSQRLRDGEPPVITRMVEDRVALDVRTIGEAELVLLVSRLEEATDDRLGQ